MKLRRWARSGLILVALCVAFTTVYANNYRDFRKVWNGRNSTNLEKMAAVQGLPYGEEGLADVYIEILESDVWQYRREVIVRVQGETDEKLLNALGEFLYDDKKVARQAAAGEHLVWALHNNATWATDERWANSGKILKNDRYPEKVRARMLRELGVFRGLPSDEAIQAKAKANVRVLIDFLDWQKDNKRKTTRELKFLTVDALENLTSEEHGDDVEKWTFFIDNLTEPLKPRQKDAFKDEFEKVEIEGHSFARKTPRPVDLELLILPNLYTSDQYWYPYIHELNKTFKCTFVKLPDCSRMDVEWLKDRAGNIDRSAYYYPLEGLVEAFEERRKESEQKKIGIIAHAVSGWIALEYLRLHPDSVAFAVIIGTWSGNQSYGQARNNLEGSRDEAFKYHGMDLLYDPSGRTGSLSLDEEQKMWAQTGSYKRRWADPKALEPVFYSTDAFKVRPEGNARILTPKYEFKDENKRNRIETPVLFVHGEQDPMFVKTDERDYSRTFQNMHWEVFKEAAGTPWAEQPVQFFEAFEGMLDKHKIIEQLKEEAASEEEN